MKRVPSFWWDFSYEPDAIIIESDDDQYPVIKKFNGVEEETIAAAEQYVVDLTEGRRDYRREAKANKEFS